MGTKEQLLERITQLLEQIDVAALQEIECLCEVYARTSIVPVLRLVR